MVETYQMTRVDVGNKIIRMSGNGKDQILYWSERRISSVNIGCCENFMTI